MSREAALRQAAESRLEQLVDMYGDPAVTEELRERLPRGASREESRRQQWEKELEELIMKDEAASVHRAG